MESMPMYENDVFLRPCEDGKLMRPANSGNVSHEARRPEAIHRYWCSP